MKLASVQSIAAALDAAKVRYLIVGGLAVAAHGFGRATFDIDIVIQLQPENIRQAMAALGTLEYRPSQPVTAAQFADAGQRETWVREKGMVVLQLVSDRHPETTIDLFVSEPFNFDQEYGRALTGEVFPGLLMRFVSLETLIEMKQSAGREKDREDVRQLKILREAGNGN